jgi:hypothetical protein
MRAMRMLIAILIALVTLSPLDAANKPVLAVLDFAKEGVSDQEMRSIISLLTSAVFKSGKYDVIDVAQRDSLLKEIEFSASDCTDQSCQIQMGKMLSAEYIVVGSLGKVGTKWVFASKLLQTESAKTLSTADGVYKDLDELVAGIPALVRELTGSGGTTAAVRQSGPISVRPIFGGVLVAAGVAALGVGGYFLYSAVTYNSGTVVPAQSAYSSLQAATGDQFTQAYDAYRSAFGAFTQKLWLGVGLAGGGAVLSGVGVALLIPSRAAQQTPAVSLLVVPPRTGVPLSVSVVYRRPLP